MAITLSSKAPGERIAYLWTPSLAVGDTISGVPTHSRIAGTATIDALTVVSGQVKIFFIGGAADETSEFLVTLLTTGGETIQETLYLPVVATPLAGLGARLVQVFPAFAAVEGNAIDYWLDQAALITGAWENDHATMLLACHYMTVNGLGTGTAAEMAANGMTGVKSLRSGALSIDFGEEAASASAQGDFASTQYGRQFLPILRSWVGGPLITGTGTIPFTRAGYPWGS